MKLTNLILAALAVSATACQMQGPDTDSADQLPNATYYIYRDQTLIENGSDADKHALEQLFADHPQLARLSRADDPSTVYLFDTIEETYALRDVWQRADFMAYRDSTTQHLDQVAEVTSAPYSYDVPTFLACNEFLLANSGPCLDIFRDGAYNLGTGQFELRDLRETTLDPRGDALFMGSTFNDSISSIGGGYDPSDPRQGSFVVQLFRDPDRGGASWTIFIDAWHPTFYDGAIHDNRMTWNHSWGDQISSIYATPSYRY
jgi:hypothetical protein